MALRTYRKTWGGVRFGVHDRITFTVNVGRRAYWFSDFLPSKMVFAAHVSGGRYGDMDDTCRSWWRVCR